MAPYQTPRTEDARGAPNALTLCALCNGHRLIGSLLAFGPGASDAMLWVCDDCQHKLARRVDDEGSLGG